MDKVSMAITYAKRNLVDLVYRAACIEGLGTTFPSTEAILNKLPVTISSSDEVLFILNMRDAYRFLLDNLDYDNSFMLIREFNKICGKGLIYGCGELRKIDVSIGGTKWRPQIPIDSDIYDAIHKLNTMEDAESKAIAYFCYLCRSQLFIDGNKRVAQLMANKILIENGIGIFAVPDDMITEFKKLLVEYYETNNALKLCQFLKSYCIERV